MKKKTIKILIEDRGEPRFGSDQEVLDTFSKILIKKNKVNPLDYTLSIEKKFVEQDSIYFTYEVKAEKNA